MEHIACEDFQCITELLSKTSCSKRSKIEKIVHTNGLFTPSQIVYLVTSFKDAADRVKLIKRLEKRMTEMTCQEASEILRSFSITNNDRLLALDCLKRHLIDHQTTIGVEYILSVFDNEQDKLRALAVVQTVSNYVADKMAAGGHQGYAACGGLYTQNWPLDEHLYGPLEDQMKRRPGHGDPCIAVHAKPGKTDSLYNSHPSYAYPPDFACYQQRPYMSAVPAQEHL